jgi:hypothetical protein
MWYHFAVEATGRFGPSALKFIKRITQRMGKEQSYIYAADSMCYCKTQWSDFFKDYKKFKNVWLWSAISCELKSIRFEYLELEF